MLLCIVKYLKMFPIKVSHLSGWEKFVYCCVFFLVQWVPFDQSHDFV